MSQLPNLRSLISLTSPNDFPTTQRFGMEKPVNAANHGWGTSIATAVDRATVERAQQNERLLSNLLNALQLTQEQTQRTFKQAQRRLAGLGDAARERISRDAAFRQGEAAQSLASRGLGNTTVVDAIQRGIADDAALQQQSVDEMVGQQTSQLLQNRASSELSLGNLLAQAMQQYLALAFQDNPGLRGILRP